jgi:putative endonuclease
MASVSGVLYVGMTNNLERRVREHKEKSVEGFTKRYNCTKLVWCEEFREVKDAIECEKRIKDWRREKKTVLIQQTNPQWKDLSENWNERTPTETAEISHFARNDNLKETSG